jgi:hypothetical protein
VLENPEVVFDQLDLLEDPLMFGPLRWNDPVGGIDRAVPQAVGEGLDEQQIQEQLLNPPRGQPEAAPPAEPPRPSPDWPEVHQELGRRSVRLRLLWREYRERYSPSESTQIRHQPSDTCGTGFDLLHKIPFLLVRKGKAGP